MTAAGLVGVGVWSLQVARRSDTQAVGARRSSWLLVVPLTLVVLCAPDPLGSALVNAGSVSGGSVPTRTNTEQPGRTNQDAKKWGRNPDGTIAYPPLSGEHPTELTLEELSDRFTRCSRPALDGMQVSVVGFASPTAQGQWRVARFKIYCCAADAVAYRVLLDGATGLVDDAWYRLTGVVDASTPELVLRVTAIVPIDQPASPYL